MTHGMNKKFNLSLETQRNSIFCKILPLGLPFDITERGKDGKLYQIHIKTQSADTVLYISVSKLKFQYFSQCCMKDELDTLNA